LNWSPDNQSTLGADGIPDPDSGEIGVSFYSAGGGGIFLLGREDDDTEEYDRGVILHEWGHYIEEEFFRSDSLGGPHTLGDRLDMRVAFGEGFASAFAGMILGDGILRDTFGPQQSAGFTIDVENVSGLNSGWYSEESIQGILYDLFDTIQDTPQDQLAIGFGPLYEVLANEQRDSVALTSLFPFIDALKTDRVADAPSIDAIVGAQAISPIMDEYGTGRVNPISPADIDVLPIYTDIAVNGGPVNDICSTNAFGASLIDPESVNKLGSRRFLKFTTTVTGDHTFTATATEVPVGKVSDPDMELHQRGALLPFPLVDAPGKSDDVNIETFSWPLTPGDYVLEVYEWSNTSPGDDPEFPPIGRTCFDVEIRTSSKPLPPIAISYEMLGEPRVGQPLEIRVTMRSQVVLTEVSVDVRGDERLVLVPETRNRNVARVPSGEAMIRTVTVTPLLDGALHVSVLVRAEINGRAQARSVLIPIQVGPSISVPEAEGVVELDESGELIISLPAQEFP
jgi:hypothetical protein